MKSVAWLEGSGFPNAAIVKVFPVGIGSVPVRFPSLKTKFANQIGLIAKELPEVAVELISTAIHK